MNASPAHQLLKDGVAIAFRFQLCFICSVFCLPVSYNIKRCGSPSKCIDTVYYLLSMFDGWYVARNMQSCENGTVKYIVGLRKTVQLKISYYVMKEAPLSTLGIIDYHYN